MTDFKIKAVSRAKESQIQALIDSKTKPQGSLGRLEGLALQIGLIQNTEEPCLRTPVLLVFAGDHGIAAEGVVNPFPQSVTAQMVMNFLNGGAAINVFAEQHGWLMKVIDAGVAQDFDEHPSLQNRKVALGTRNLRVEPAMTAEQCEQAIQSGAEAVRDLQIVGTNVVGFGEMGIGNTSSAALLMHRLTGISLDDCVGAGTGLDEEGVDAKFAVLREALQAYEVADDPASTLAAYGGFEIAMLVGAILQAAELKMVIVVDGFIVSAACLVAISMDATVRDYCVFAHTSEEKGHEALLAHLEVQPLLNLGLRLGEGTGAALALPFLQASLGFLLEMASFEQAGVDGAHDA